MQKFEKVILADDGINIGFGSKAVNSPVQNI
jgi:predicted phosphoribosyltransferase